MFVVIYRWRLKEGAESAFTEAWEKTTSALMEYGAMGSALFATHDGTYYAIAKWPDEKTREEVFGSWDDGGLIAQMQAAVAERFPEIRLHEIINLW